ncbi:protein yippee-like 5 isoform X1 [Acropora palmata]|uniref:protein yippee-like 5 isoform X1 n=1 Tax=Acropora palmata TaxID=6131 RepID=UPI003DA09A6F
MGRIFLDHPGGSRLYSCAQCDTALTNRSLLTSMRFNGATGRAFLFKKVYQTTFGKCLSCIAMVTVYGAISRLLFQDQPHLICNIPSCTRLVNYGTIYQTNKDVGIPIYNLKLVNLSYSEVQDREMLTGRHMVRDVFCKNCDTKLGWMYEYATEESQQYKEGQVILERALVTESEGIRELLNSDTVKGIRYLIMAQKIGNFTS